MKKRVDTVHVERKYDFFIVTDKNESNHTVYADNYDKILKYLMEIDEMEFKDCFIPPEVIAKKLCEEHPELETKMFRPTGKYYNLYHFVLKILDFYRYIDYYKDGTVLKHDKLKDITPVKRGVDKWI